MKLKHVLKRLENFLSADERTRIKQRDAMKRVLHKLKGKERKLARAAEEAKSGNARRELEKKRQVVHAQRRKGIAALKALKKKS